MNHWGVRYTTIGLPIPIPQSAVGIMQAVGNVPVPVRWEKKKDSKTKNKKEFNTENR